MRSRSLALRDGKCSKQSGVNYFQRPRVESTTTTGGHKSAVIGEEIPELYVTIRDELFILHSENGGVSIFTLKAFPRGFYLLKAIVRLIVFAN